jgi:LPS-assembly lipoprotein
MMRTLFTSLAVTTTLLLSGCGFTPMHATGSSGKTLQDVVVNTKKVTNVADNNAGFLITQRLRDRIGVPSSSTRYTLEVTPKYRRARLGLTDGDVASRYDVTVQARWKLINNKNGRVLGSGSVSTVSTFGAPAGPYGVITADNVGVEQAATETADKLVIEMARAFAKRDKRQADRLKAQDAAQP